MKYYRFGPEVNVNTEESGRSVCEAAACRECLQFITMMPFFVGNCAEPAQPPARHNPGMGIPNNSAFQNIHSRGSN